MGDSFERRNPGMMWVNAESGLRIRDLPGLGGSRVTTLDHHTEVRFLARVGDKKEISGVIGRWTLIAYGDEFKHEGWAFGGFLTGADPTQPIDGRGGGYDDEYSYNGDGGMYESSQGPIMDPAIIEEYLQVGEWLPQDELFDIGILISFQGDHEFTSWNDSTSSDDQLKYVGTWSIGEGQHGPVITISVKDQADNSDHVIIIDYTESYINDYGLLGLYLNVLLDGEIITLASPMVLQPAMMLDICTFTGQTVKSQ